MNEGPGSMTSDGNRRSRVMFISWNQSVVRCLESTRSQANRRPPEGSARSPRDRHTTAALRSNRTFAPYQPINTIHTAQLLHVHSWRICTAVPYLGAAPLGRLVVRTLASLSLRRYVEFRLVFRQPCLRQPPFRVVCIW